jgi:ceramide glucosyltransferase
MPSVMLTRRFWGMRFAFGSTIAIPAEVLEGIGGFRPLADELADDYLLGSGAWRVGKQIVLSEYVVDNVLGQESLRAMWTRRLRWARTMRGLQPLPYFGSVLTHGTPMALLFAAVSGLNGLGLWFLAGTLTLRGITATWICSRYTRDAILPAKLWLLPFSDLVSFGLWLGAHLGNTVEWRGVRYRMGRGGSLTPMKSKL